MIKKQKIILTTSALLLFSLVLSIFSSELLSRSKESDPAVFGFQFQNAKDKLIVLGVISGSPADDAGLKAGDYITGLNSAPLSAAFLKKPLKFLGKISEATFTVDSQGTIKKISIKKKRLSSFASKRQRYAQPPLQMLGYRKGDHVADMKPLFKKGKKSSSLYQVKAKYKLILFWATWCKACRQRIPSYTWARKRFSEKSLAIISVSLDENRSREIVYAQKHNMNWYHYREPGLGGNEKFDNQWKIHSIPVAVLLDQDHKIIEIISSRTRLAPVLEKYL